MQADGVSGVDIELRDLRLAVVTSQHRSLRQAAEALNIHQSTLSRRSHEIERQVGVVLFERTNGGTRLTMVGLEFIVIARQSMSMGERRVAIASPSQTQTMLLTRKPGSCSFLVNKEKAMSPPAPVSPLESHLGYQLRIVSNAVSQSFARAVEKEGVTVAEWVLMRVLQDFESLAPTLLAERMRMTKGAITKLGSRLVDKGLVKREANPDDKRAQTLSLTSRGRSIVPILARIADENDAAFFDLLPVGERGNLNRILGRIIKLRRLKDVPTD